MAARIFNGLLIVGIIAGGVLALMEGMRNRQLKQQHNELAAEFGNLSIGDPDKIHVIALRSDHPLHFRWRIYIPANLSIQFRHRYGSNTGQSSEPRDFIAFTRFRFADEGLQVFAKQDLGSAQMGVGNAKFASLLQANWDDVQIEQAGSGEMLVVDDDQIITLLEVRMNDKLTEKARQQLPPNASGSDLVPVIFVEEMGTRSAFEERSKQQVTP